MIATTEMITRGRDESSKAVAFAAYAQTMNPSIQKKKKTWQQVVVTNNLWSRLHNLSCHSWTICWKQFQLQYSSKACNDASNLPIGLETNRAIPNPSAATPACTRFVSMKIQQPFGSAFHGEEELTDWSSGSGGF